MLYRDPNTSAALVIERKTVIWPRDHAARHRNYHTVAETLSDVLRDFARGRTLSIHLALPHRMSRGELSTLPRSIAEEVRASELTILNGQAIGVRDERVRWSCYLDEDDRSASDEPATGLIVRWNEPDEWLPSDLLPRLLVDDIKKHLRSTVEKFRNYSDARGILLLDPHGYIRYTDRSWWCRALRAAPVPSAIAEVWLATYDWLTDVEQGWSFDRVHPLDAAPVL